MANPGSADNLYDPRRDEQPIRVDDLEIKGGTLDPPRTNCFSVYFIEQGAGTFWADSSRYAFEARSLLFFVPYQQIRLAVDAPTRGTAIRFHANFLCVETFHAEVGCSGILFNDPAGVPVLSLDADTAGETARLIDRLRREQQEQELAFREAMLCDLKVLLILATRIKSMAAEPSPVQTTGLLTGDPRHPVLMELRELIEVHYQTLHTPADYARLLHITPRTLGRIVRENLGTTPTELIRGRILTHAKWQLLHTLRPVKEIAREVGYADELYFSRLFKKATGCSPTFFREYETEIRGGSNLSMVSSAAPILPAGPSGESAMQTNHLPRLAGS